MPVNRQRKRFARLTLCLEYSMDLLRRIPGIPVIKNVLESHRLILALESIHVIIDSDIADIIVREYDLNVLTGFQVVSAESAQIFGNDRSHFVCFNICHHRLEAVSLKRCSRNSVINVVNGIAETVILRIFFEDSFLIGDAVALTL